MTKDKRYREIEEKILQLFFEYGYSLTASMVAEKLGVARSTFYRHHKTVQDILPDYIKLILEDAKVDCKGSDEGCVQKFFMGVLILIVREKEIFLIFLKMQNREILVLILLRNEKLLLKYADFRVEAGSIYNIYVNEVVAVVDDWGKEGFPCNKVNVVLGDIMYLTRTMKVRLGPLVRY